MTTFGLMTFGAEAINWDPEVFFYRTGIAIRLRKEMAGNGEKQPINNRIR